MVLGEDRESAGKVREYSVAAEFGRGFNTASEGSIVKFIRVVVV
jgi:hypothetical protein